MTCDCCRVYGPIKLPDDYYQKLTEQFLKDFKIEIPKK